MRNMRWRMNHAMFLIKIIPVIGITLMFFSAVNGRVTSGASLPTKLPPSISIPIALQKADDPSKNQSRIDHALLKATSKILNPDQDAKTTVNETTDSLAKALFKMFVVHEQIKNKMPFGNASDDQIYNETSYPQYLTDNQTAENIMTSTIIPAKGNLTVGQTAIEPVTEVENEESTTMEVSTDDVTVTESEGNTETVADNDETTKSADLAELSSINNEELETEATMDSTLDDVTESIALMDTESTVDSQNDAIQNNSLEVSADDRMTESVTEPKEQTVQTTIEDNSVTISSSSAAKNTGIAFTRIRTTAGVSLGPESAGTKSTDTDMNLKTEPVVVINVLGFSKNVIAAVVVSALLVFAGSATCIIHLLKMKAKNSKSRDRLIKLTRMQDSDEEDLIYEQY